MKTILFGAGLVGGLSITLLLLLRQREREKENALYERMMRRQQGVNVIPIAAMWDEDRRI